MQLAPFRRKPSFSLSGFGFYAVALPVAAAIVAAIWLAAAAAFENVRFAQTADQILSIVALAREDAARDANFARLPGENLLEVLERRGRISPSAGAPAGGLANAWRGAIRVRTAQPSLMRLETDLPARDCRRLAVFFGDDAKGLALQKMEAREYNGSWQPFYDAAPGAPAFSQRDAATACGRSEQVTLALTLRLR